MLSNNTFKFDVLLIGGGGAGLRAAIAIAETNPNFSVAVISKVYPMRSHTVAAEGGAAAVIKENDSFDDHCMDTIAGGDWMSDQDAVELFVNEAPKELTQMEHWGCPWNREPDGKIAVRPFGGMSIERTWFAADKTGFHMLHTLFQTSLKYNNITRFDEWFTTKILVENGRCQGAAAIELRSGKVGVFAAKAVIMCTGGAGRVFPFTTNGNIKTGDGMAMAYRTGVPLKDMEFIQYHPTGLPGTGILITEATRGEEYDQVEQNLLAGIKSDNIGLQTSSAYFLGEMHSDKSLIDLLKLARYGNTEESRIIAGLSLYKIESNIGMYLLKSLRESDESEKVRITFDRIYNKYISDNRSFKYEKS